MLAKEEMITDAQKKNMWALASALRLEKENLYSIIHRISGGDSMRALTKKQANLVLTELHHYSDKGRTDIGGRKETANIRKKIYMLTKDLGWNDNRSRIDGFVKKTFQVERLEWLEFDDCLKLVEILKKMVTRLKGGGSLG